MADIRIKDITTTASASLTGDFLPIDGTTGTRKLSAFSPTFGGNATVTGTLTTNSTFASSGSGTTLTSQFANTLTGAANILNLQLRRGDSANGFSRLMWGTGATTEWSLGSRSGDTNLYVWDEVANAERLKIASSTGNVSIASTSASTSTSSGALVVGNGTSGGLGVGGSVNIHNNLTLGYASAGDSVLKIIRSSGGNEWLQIAGWSAGSLGNNAYSIDAVNGASARPVYFRRSTDAGSTYTNFLTWDTSNNATFAGAINAGVSNSANSITGGDSGSGTYILQLKDGGGNLKVNFKGNGDIAVLSSSISSSTSSGALVVSGGVGVAKRIHSGEGLTVSADSDTQVSFVRNGTVSIGPTSAATPKLAVGGGLQLSNTSQSIPAWGDVGAQLSVAGAVLTDTSSSGTVGRIVTNSIAASALAASSTTTYTAAASLFIAGAPTANTNVTITNAYALYTAGGRINFQGLPTSSAGLQAGTLWNDGGTLKVA